MALVAASCRAPCATLNVVPLEGLCWGRTHEGDFTSEPHEAWSWQILIRVPDVVRTTVRGLRLGWQATLVSALDLLIGGSRPAQGELAAGGRVSSNRVAGAAATVAASRPSAPTTTKVTGREQSSNRPISG